MGVKPLQSSAPHPALEPGPSLLCGQHLSPSRCADDAVDRLGALGRRGGRSGEGWVRGAPAAPSLTTASNEDGLSLSC